MILGRRCLNRRVLALGSDVRCPSWRQRRFAAQVAKSNSLPIAFLNRARAIAAEHEDISKTIAANYDVTAAKKLGQLGATTTALKEWESANKSLTELQQILDDPESDQELRIIAAEEIDGATEIVGRVSTELKKTLVPIHPFEHLPCLLELRPGAGGSEAALFAGDLLRMYQAFCRQRGLRSTIISLDDAEGGGNESMIHEAIVEIDGEGAYGLLRCEAGVHRVQRVPATEKQGRTHTSAVSVIVLPSFPENSNDSPELSIDDPSSDYYIDPTDVRTDVYRSRGAGGQHVNTTDSAVRLTHVPTNTVVAMQESRSQQKNRSKAWQILRSRLAQARREAREEEIAKIRVGVVGVAKMGRGDKIRTYNWGQQRVTDHRSGYTAHNLDDVLDGGEGLEEVMKSVKGWLMERELEALGAEEEMKAKEGNKS